MQEDLRRVVETQFFQELYKTLPKVRLAPYHIPNVVTAQIDALTLYMYNAAVSQSLYVPLQNFEVGMRNGLHAALSDQLGTPEWYDRHAHRFNLDGQKTLTKALEDVRKRKIGLKPGDVVAALNLGFWHSLFDEDCHVLAKPSFITYVFPYAPDEYKEEAAVPRLYALIADIKNLRNRISHYERIWNLGSPSVDALYNRLLKMIGWMSRDLNDLTRMDDTYPRLMKVGRIAYQEECRKKLERLFEEQVRTLEAYLTEKEKAKTLENERKKAKREADKQAKNKLQET